MSANVDVATLTAHGRLIHGSGGSFFRAALSRVHYPAMQNRASPHPHTVITSQLLHRNRYFIPSSTDHHRSPQKHKRKIAVLASTSPHAMLLAASPFAPPSVRSPHRPSPLAERPVNVPTPRARYLSPFAMPKQTTRERGGGGDKNTTCGMPAAPRRGVRTAPLGGGRDAVAARRRDLFLGRVRSGREEARWGARSDQV